MVDDYVKVASGKTADPLLRRPSPPHLGGDVRHHGLPRADHADLHGHERLLRRQGRQAAQGHGQEEARRHARPAGGLEHGRRGERLLAGHRQADLGRRREVREVRLQQVALRRLRHPGHAHGVPEGALPERLHGRRAVQSYMGNTDRLIRYIASCNHNGHARAAPRHQLLQRRSSRPPTTASASAWWACAAWARTSPRPSSPSARPTARTPACTTS